MTDIKKYMMDGNFDGFKEEIKNYDIDKKYAEFGPYSGTTKSTRTCTDYYGDYEVEQELQVFKYDIDASNQSVYLYDFEESYNKCGTEIKWTILQYSCALGKYDFIKHLIEKKANKSIKDETGKTALDILKLIHPDDKESILLFN